MINDKYLSKMVLPFSTYGPPSLVIHLDSSGKYSNLSKRSNFVKLLWQNENKLPKVEMKFLLEKDQTKMSNLEKIKAFFLDQGLTLPSLLSQIWMK